jgi:hypothetical protein
MHAGSLYSSNYSLSHYSLPVLRGAVASQGHGLFYCIRWAQVTIPWLVSYTVLAGLSLPPQTCVSIFNTRKYRVPSFVTTTSDNEQYRRNSTVSDRLGIYQHCRVRKYVLRIETRH